MLNTLWGDGFDRLLTLISIKMQHPRPLQGCTNVCIIFAHTGAGVIRVFNVAFGLMSFGLMSFGLMSHSHLAIMYVVRFNVVWLNVIWHTVDASSIFIWHKSGVKATSFCKFFAKLYSCTKLVFFLY